MPHLRTEIVPPKTLWCALGAGEQLSFILERDCRRTVRLRVRPDGVALVRAPLCFSEKDIRSWVAGRSAWIKTRQEYFLRLQAELPRPGYTHGAVQRYLGRICPLRVLRHVRAGVEYGAGGFQVSTRGEPTAAKVRRLLDAWFAARAQEVFRQRLEVWLPAIRAEGVSLVPALKVRAMKSRYGSCSCRGVIALSRHLTAVPLECIDFVLVHELCHLRHFAHDQAFYALLGRLLPDWKERKAVLRRFWQTQF